MPYHIDPKRCSRCGACLEACPMEAVVSDAENRFFIDPDRCTDCGSCADACPENAVRGGQG